MKENDLAHGEFGKWLQSINMNHDTANKMMKIANELNSNSYTYMNLGSRALYEIATLPESERAIKHTTSSGETKTPDEKLYKELGYKNFEEYSINNFGYSNDTMNERIKAANEFGENYNGALRSYGQHKTHQLATMPEEQRNHVIENGIETNNGNKSIDEATTRELEEYKKQLKQRDEEKIQLESQLEQAQRSESIARKQ